MRECKHCVHLFSFTELVRDGGDELRYQTRGEVLVHFVEEGMLQFCALPHQKPQANQLVRGCKHIEKLRESVLIHRYLEQDVALTFAHSLTQVEILRYLLQLIVLLLSVKLKLIQTHANLHEVVFHVEFFNPVDEVVHEGGRHHRVAWEARDQWPLESFHLV